MTRPSGYSQEIVAKICDRLADGESLRSICRDEDMPAKSTVFLWLADNNEFEKQYIFAREAQADTLVDDILEIADDGSNDWMQRNSADNPGWQANGENIQRSRLRVDARKWVAGKMRPKAYGDKITQVHSDPDGKPLNTGPTIIFTGSPAGASPPQTVVSPADGSD